MDGTPIGRADGGSSHGSGRVSGEARRERDESCSLGMGNRFAVRFTRLVGTPKPVHQKRGDPMNDLYVSTLLWRGVSRVGSLSIMVQNRANVLR